MLPQQIMGAAFELLSWRTVVALVSVLVFALIFALFMDSFGPGPKPHEHEWGPEYPAAGPRGTFRDCECGAILLEDSWGHEVYVPDVRQRPTEGNRT